MIRYDLICGEGHAFDGWFSDSASFDQQRARGFVACPECGSNKIEKQLMAPRLGTRSNAKPEASVPVVSSPQSEKQRELLSAMRKLRAYVESNADDVGTKFAEEARRIHYNEAEARGIYGQASLDEAKELVEEGIEIAPLPRLPEDGN